MAKYTSLIAVIMVMSQCSDTRNIGSTRVRIGETERNSTAYLTYDELFFILKSRHGIESAQPKRLTPCARAILGCCNNKVMNEYCSESLKCGAYFFDDNPCDDKFIIDALEAAKNFYEQFDSKNKIEIQMEYI